MHGNMNLLVSDHEIQQILLNLWHIFNSYSLDCEMWPNFSYSRVRSVI